MSPFAVKKHSITIPVSVVAYKGGTAYRIEVRSPGSGRSRFTTLDRDKAKEKAEEMCRMIAQGSMDLAALTAAQNAMVREALRLELTIEDIHRAAATRVASSLTVSEARDMMIDSKAAATGDRSLWMATLSTRLNPVVDALGEEPMDQVTVSDLERALDTGKSPRTRSNQRAATVQLWEWARKRGYVPDQTTEAARLEPIRVAAGEIDVYSPEEMVALLRAFPTEHLPWPLISGFCGLRTEEVCPRKVKPKPTLRWEDIDFPNREIRIPADVVKGRADRRRGRIVPMPENLVEMLTPLAKPSGPVMGVTAEAALRRLGASRGDAKTNGFRKSYATYRAAVTQNPHQVAMEMGNSQAVLDLHYRTPEAQRNGERWFAIRV